MSGEISSFFLKHLSLNSHTHEEQLLSSLLFSDNVNIHLGDRRLNNIAALTYNTHQCDLIFKLLETSLIPENNPWQTLYKAVLVLHTIVLYGSEYAVDKAINICDLIQKLQTYNSALVKKSMFSLSSGGTDYGSGVRQVSKALHTILLSDDEIRNARALAHEDADSLVPLGDLPVENLAPPPLKLNFGQGLETSVGAGYDLSAVPGMYDGRPERYFDDQNDIRKPHHANDHQFTREAMNPNSLLDLAFDSPSPASSSSLPPVEYLPAIEEQKELRRLLAEQQQQLERLRVLTQQQQQQQMQQQHSQSFQLTQPSMGYQLYPQGTPLYTSSTSPPPLGSGHMPTVTNQNQTPMMSYPLQPPPAGYPPYGMAQGQQPSPYYPQQMMPPYQHPPHANYNTAGYGSPVPGGYPQSSAAPYPPNQQRY